MKKKHLNYKKLTLDIDDLYKNDFNLQKTIAQTKKLRHNNKSLEIRKNKLKELVTEINNEYRLNREPSKKILHDNNVNFHNEYELFNKTTNKKDTKIIFKDLVKLYNSKGYRIPNFSINDHNLFKINALLETNTDMISNGFLEQQISKKRDAGSDKIIKYLKKLGFILSAKMSNDANLQKMLTKKFKMPKFKVFINDEDTVKDLKEKIEMLNNLINTIELEELDEKRKRKQREDSRKNSFSYNNYNKRTSSLFKKEKYYISRRESNKKDFQLSNRNSKEIDFFIERKKSKNSSNSNTSFASNHNFHIKKINKEKSTKTLKLFNFASHPGKKIISFPQTSKNINIPVINFNKEYQKKDSDSSIITVHENRKNFNKTIIDLKKNFSNKKNNTYISSKNNKFISYKSSTITDKYLNLNIDPIQKNHNLKYPLFIKTQSNNDSNSNNYNDISDDLALDSKSQNPTEQNKNNSSLKDTERKKNDSNNYPYTSRNEFINFAYNKFSKRNSRNAEEYIKSYLHKVKGYDKQQIETAVNDIYDKNIKNNIKELEKQINSNDLYYKTERLYLNSHLIQRIKPLLYTMGERDKTINKLEKNLANAVSTK